LAKNVNDEDVKKDTVSGKKVPGSSETLAQASAQADLGQASQPEIPTSKAENQK